MRNFKCLVKHGKAVARTARHLPCPLASAAENSSLDIFQSALALARLEGLQLHPVSFRKFPGRRGETFIFPSEGDSPHLTGSACSGARKKTGTNSGRTVPFRRNPEQLNFTGK